MQKLSKKSTISAILVTLVAVVAILICCLLFLGNNDPTKQDGITTDLGANYSYADGATASSGEVSYTDTLSYRIDVVYSTKYIETLGATIVTQSASSSTYRYFNPVIKIQFKSGLIFSGSSITCLIGTSSVTLTYDSGGYWTKTSYSFTNTSGSGCVYFNVTLPQLTPTTTLYFEENGGSAVSDITVTCDSPISSSALPTPTRAGYNFAGWYVDGNQISNTTYYTWGEPKTAFAKWEPVSSGTTNYALTSSVNNTSYGTIIGASATYPANSNVTLNAVPSANCRFSYWTINNAYTTTQNPLNFSMSAATTVQAVFEPAPAISSFTVNFANGGGTYTVEQTNNDYALITISPDVGQYINSIQFDGGVSTPIEYYNGSITNCGSNVLYATYLTNNNDQKNTFKLSLHYILGNGAVTVTTTNTPPTLEENTGGTNIDGIALKSTDGGEARVVGNGDSVTLVAVSFTGYEFLYWEGSKSGTISSNMSYSISQEDYAGEVITAVFAPIGSNNINDSTDFNSDDFVII